jgi:hypothetical protein
MKAQTIRKLDLRKQLSYLYSPKPGEVQVMDVPSMRFLMVDGRGDPNSTEFQDAVKTLYNLTYTVKFSLKKEGLWEYPVSPLEGLWWIDGPTMAFDSHARESWRWTIMIMQPEFVTKDRIGMAAELAAKKGKNLVEYRLEDFKEGVSAQTMHVGPYSSEPETIKTIWRFIDENGYLANGKHHEVYMGDPRRVAPSRLKTILRQPIKKKKSAGMLSGTSRRPLR